MITESPDPIFILGMTRRSGTNFLMQLLTLHPDLESVQHLREDYLLCEADPLMVYVHQVYNHWAYWDIDPSLEASLLQHLGQGMISFLTSLGTSKRIVVKTPSVENLPHFFNLFPSAYLLILIRDGRSVVESMVRSFDWAYETATRRWAAAARTVLTFDRVHRDSDLKYLIIKYEDLILNPDDQLKTIFDFLDLDGATYDFDAAHNLPVFGSSVFRGKDQDVHWNPVAKTQDFHPPSAAVGALESL